MPTITYSILFIVRCAVLTTMIILAPHSAVNSCSFVLFLALLFELQKPPLSIKVTFLFTKLHFSFTFKFLHFTDFVSQCSSYVDAQ